MSGAAKATIDHEVIRKWAEARKGKPAHVKRTGKGDDPGVLRIDFPGYSGEESLEHISWEEWFAKFDEANLAMLFQDKTADGHQSRFSKLVSRDTVEENVEVVTARGSEEEEAEESDEAEANTTIDHAEIRRWVEKRGGTPARVKGRDILRIDFPGYSGEDTLEEISWKHWFQVFEDSQLAFLHQDKTKSGKISRFSKLVKRDRPSKAA